MQAENPSAELSEQSPDVQSPKTRSPETQSPKPQSSERPCAFVAGATGYTGREVVAALRSRGVRTVAHVRPDSSRLQEWRARFEALGAEVDTTPWQLEAIASTLEQLRPTYVFALLGTTRARAARGPSGAVDNSYKAVDYGLSAMLLEAATGVSPAPCFVYLSAMGVDSSAANQYMAVRKRLEGELRSSGLPFVIARPGFISGPDRDEARPMERLFATLADGALDLFGHLGATDLRAKYHSLSGVELAGGLVRAALDPAAHGKILSTEALR